MNVLESYGHEDLALLYVAETGDGSLVEFVESTQPPLPREEKWVLIVSTLRGCPANCLMCDAGGAYTGPLSVAEILSQIDAMVDARFPDRHIPIPKFKIQFARMGEPALNDAVLDVLRVLPGRYSAPGMMPCLSTIMPRRREGFFSALAEIKNELFGQGRFQMQFSLHTTDTDKRNQLINFPVLSFAEAAKIGGSFFRTGDRKIALNFALAEGYPVDAAVLSQYFDPSIYLIKLTPLNPTDRGRHHGLRTRIDPSSGAGSAEVVSALKIAGYNVILSLGEPEEDTIGSNCGQYVTRYRRKQEAAGV
jgi:23S rRNA (adenine2503-C2)-methyltransferase